MRYLYDFSTELKSPILSIAPIEQQDALLLCTVDGLYQWNFSSQKLMRIMSITLPTLPESNDPYRPPHYQLYSSKSGLYSAIVINYGQFGQVFDHKEKNVILNLNGQHYYDNMVPFSLAFCTLEQDDIVIYRSDWNRLDSFNLTQKKSSTERDIAPYQQENRPEHYLDYFHGALSVSPDGKYLLDDGWLWQGIAMTHLCSLQDWLTKNPFESEDGKSLQSIAFEEEGWDYPICWQTEDTFLMWQNVVSAEEHDGAQGHESVVCPHVRMNQILADQSIQTELWKMPEQTQKILNMYADDGKLMIIGNENISIYDIHSRQCIKQIPNTLPQKQHINRHSLWSFQQHHLIETPYKNMDIAHA